MPADPTIRIGMTATTGQAEAQIQSAYQKMAAASLELQNVQSRHASILKEYRSSALDASVASQLLAQNLQENAAATAAVTEAKLALIPADRAATAAEEAHARALAIAAEYSDEASAATGRLTSNYYAAQGAAGLLEGRIPIRAFERFIATIGPVAGLLSAAFPIIGAVALIEILFKAGEELVKFGEKAEDLAQELNVNWLQGAIDELSGLGDKIDEIDKKIQGFNRDIDQSVNKQKELSYEAIGRAYGPSAESSARSQALAQEEQRLRSLLPALQDRLRIEKQIAEIKGVGSGPIHPGDFERDQAARREAEGAGVSKQPEVAARQAVETQKEIAAIQAEADAKHLEAVRFANEAVKQETPHTKKEREAREDYGDKLAALEEQRGGKNIVFEVEYWRQVVAETGKYHEQLIRAEEEEGKLVQKMGEASKFKKELARDEDKSTPKPATADLQKFIDYENQTGEAYARYREEVAKGNQVLTENADRLREVNIQIAEQSGAITKVQADHALGAAKAKEYADKIAELREQMAALRASLPQAQIEGKGGEVSAEIQRLQNQIYVLQGQAAQSGAQNQAKTTQDLAAPYIKATDQINSAWLSMQNKLIFGTRNVSQAFANMGVSMLESFAAAWEKMLVKQLQAEIRMMIQHQVTKQAEVAGDAAAAAESDRISELSSIKQVFHAAKVAATKAFKHYADVPPVPFVAAAAAAGTFALALSVGAFEKGGLITAPTLALMGESGTEAVLPSRLTNLLLNVANGASSTTNQESTVFNQQNHYSGITDRDFRQKLRKHSAEVGHAVVREMRGGRRR